MRRLLRWLAGPVLRGLGLEVRVPKGARIGRGVWLGRGAWLDPSHGRHITIGDDVTISQQARILCHDASSQRRIGMTWVAPVTICDRAFVGAGAIVLPGVTIGEDSVVAAGAVVSADVPPRCVVGGVPAKVIGDVDSLDARRLALIRQGAKVFDPESYAAAALDPARAAELDEAATGASGGYFLGRPTGR